MSKPRKYQDLPDTQWSRRYSRAQSQAQFRGEGWAFTPLAWYTMWTNSGMTPGRSDSYGCMTRKDKSQPWSMDNCQIVPRRTHMRKNFYENCLKMEYVEEPYVN